MTEHKKREKEVMLECRRLLDALKSFKFLDYFRITTGGIKRGPVITPNHDMVGFSDILVLLPNPLTLFIELKAEDGQQSDKQKEFQYRIQKMGHKYYLCDSAKRMKDILIENSTRISSFFK